MVNAALWILAIIAFLVLESVTAALVSIWFAGGSFAALLAMLLGAGTKLQIFVFLAVSVVCIVLLRKIAIKGIQGKQKKTNLDRIIGQNVIIAQGVENNKQEGIVILNDIEWKVKSEDGTPIDIGETMTVVGIEGVKLIVKAKEAALWK